MSEAGPDIARKILAFATVVEAGTGIALMVDPAIVISLLLGVSASLEGTSLGRFLGVALFALGWASWPGRQHARYGSQVFQGMLLYNVLVALYLACLGTVGGLGGLLLWPAVVLHGGVAGVMGWVWREHLN
jgi:hypothetical protein